jgi:hypothetical protein
MNLIVSGTPNNMIFSILILAFWLYMFVLLIVPIGFLQLGACGCIPPENIYIYIYTYIYISNSAWSSIYPEMIAIDLFPLVILAFI